MSNKPKPTYPIPLGISAVLEAVRQEVLSAEKKSGPLHSAHEGYGVLLEEVDELWDQVRCRPDQRDAKVIREEAIQIAATAVRIAIQFGDHR